MKWLGIIAGVLVLLIGGTALANFYLNHRDSARLKEAHQQIDDAKAAAEALKAEVQQRLDEKEALDKRLALSTAKVKQLSGQIVSLQGQRNEAIVRANQWEQQAQQLHAKLAQFDAERAALPKIQTLEQAVKELNRLGY